MIAGARVFPIDRHVSLMETRAARSCSETRLGEQLKEITGLGCKWFQIDTPALGNREAWGEIPRYFGNGGWYSNSFYNHLLIFLFIISHVSAIIHAIL